MYRPSFIKNVFYRSLGIFFNLSLSGILKRFLNVRFVLLSPKGRLSQFNSYVEGELRLNNFKSLADRSKAPKVFFINPYEIPNNSLLKAYAAHAKFITLDLHSTTGFKKLLRKMFYKVMLALSRDDGFVRLGHAHSGIQYNFVWSACPPILDARAIQYSVNSPEYKSLVSKVDLHKPYCLLAFRDSAYYKAHVNESRNPQSSDSFSFRNPRFEDYIPFVDWLISQGIQVIRVGLKIDPLDFCRDGFYDLSGVGYSSDLDVFLASQCKFMIIGACGYFYQGAIFNKPTLVTHSYSVYFNGSDFSVLLPSKYQRNGVDLTLSETYILGINEPPPKGISLKHPSPAEILAEGVKFVRMLDDPSEIRRCKEKLQRSLLGLDLGIDRLAKDRLSEEWLISNFRLYD